MNARIPDSPELPPLRLEWRTPSELADNPRNWRLHPPEQIAAITGVFAEVGWAGACLFNERTGRLIDGHARKKIAIEQGATAIPVLVGSWSDEDEAKILASLDPLAGMAQTDASALAHLLAEVETAAPGLQALLDQLATQAEGVEPLPEDEPADPDAIPEKFQILVDFADERQQADWLERLTSEGLTCRSLIS